MDDNQPSTLQPLDASRLVINLTTQPRPVPEKGSRETIDAGICSDHMVLCTWSELQGWGIPEIKPYGAIAMMPTASVLHYATSCFEGMKLYRGVDGSLRLFRPRLNCERMNLSADRVGLPRFEEEELEKLIIRLAEVDGPRWLPKENAGGFLYVRPTLIGSSAAIGVKVPKEAILFILICPFPDFTDLPPIKLLANNQDTRAWPGGFGHAKIGANYGPFLVSARDANAQGYNQILWLFGDEGFVTEAGVSNVFVIWKTVEGTMQMITPPLGQTQKDQLILDGVTRRSVLDLAKERLSVRCSDGSQSIEGLEVVERPFRLREVELAATEGRLVEAFVTGTAVCITSIGEIRYDGGNINVPTSQGKRGPYANLLRKWHLAITSGTEEHEWAVLVDEGR